MLNTNVMVKEHDDIIGSYIADKKAIYYYPHIDSIHANKKIPGSFSYTTTVPFTYRDKLIHILYNTGVAI